MKGSSVHYSSPQVSCSVGHSYNIIFPPAPFKFTGFFAGQKMLFSHLSNVFYCFPADNSIFPSDIFLLTKDNFSYNLKKNILPIILISPRNKINESEKNNYEISRIHGARPF
jgi:hypothetical protein